MMKMRNICLVLVCMVTLPPIASAKTTYMTAARLEYPNIVGSAINSCALCHSSGSNRNPYGSDYQSNGHNFQDIENMDSDNDGFSNIDEIDALKFPGNPTSFPIVIGTITVKKPNGGESWTIGAKELVTWDSAGDAGTDVSIELWQNGHKVKTLKGSTPNDGKQRIKLKDTLPTGSGFTIVVTSLMDSSIFDESDATFDIVPAVP